MKRLGYLLRLDFSENMKSLLWASVAMLLVYLFFFWWAHNIGVPLDYYSLSHGLYSQEHLEMVTKAQCEAVGNFGALAMYFCFLLTANRLYSMEQKKQQRIALLMLPATNLEKFLARWIYMIEFSVVVGILTFIVADVLHMLWLSSAGRPVIAATKYFFGIWPSDAKWKILAANVYAAFVAIHSIYLFGGIFFRRYHIAVTSLLFVFVAVITRQLVEIIEIFTDYPDSYTTAAKLNMYYLVVFAIFSFGIALFTWLSYKVFCRWQLTDRKFVNL